MIISLEWLKSYVDVTVPVDRLAALLTDGGLEVESVERQSERLAGFVIGSVLTCDKHPKADKLTICDVDHGAGIARVVCGAPNVRPGQKVVLALPGALVPRDGFRIEERKIRGIASAGMICSAAELTISDDHSGIMVLPSDASVGMPAAEYFGETDVLFEIGITPNRADALSHVGVARDVAALTGARLAGPPITPDREGVADGNFVSVEVPDMCPRYSAAIVRGIRVGDAPEWMRRRLGSAGVRPVNNVVDVTNYVMLELGHPMHAFDLRRIAGERIVVRAGREGETFTTLDGKSRTLAAGAVLICDGEEPVAIGGIMGGANSEIAGDTTDVLLESAYFLPASIRKTSRQLGLSTDSSYRFERGADPNVTLRALGRAIDLLRETAGGTVQAMADAYPAPIEPLHIDLRPGRVARILGIDVSRDRIASILDALGMEPRAAGDVISCTVPTFRSDITREIDLIEEIARIHGYDRIPTPTTVTIHTGARHDGDSFASRLREACIALGLDETQSSSLIDRGKAELFAPGATVSVRNPVSSDRPTLRPSIIPSLLETVDFNLRNGTQDIRIFEIGSVFSRRSEGKTDLEDPLGPYEEKIMLGIALSGQAVERTWHTREREADFYDLKGIVESLLEKLHLDNHGFICYDTPGTLSDYGLWIHFQGSTAGSLMSAAEEIRQSFGIDRQVFLLECDVEKLLHAASPGAKYQAISKFPPVLRDLAFVFDAGVQAAEVLDCIRDAERDIIRQVDLVDLFEHESLGADRKSLAFSLLLRAFDRTLTEEEIAGTIEKVVKGVQDRFGGILRSS